MNAKPIWDDSHSLLRLAMLKDDKTVIIQDIELKGILAEMLNLEICAYKEN